MKNKIILSLTTVALVVSVSVFAKGGQHNVKTCYVTMNDGSTASSPCSARGTSCLDNFKCTIDGIPGMGTHKKGMTKVRTLMKPQKPLKPTKDITVTKGKAQDYNSSRSNTTSLRIKTDVDEKKIKLCLKMNKKLNREDCIKKLGGR